MARSLYIVGMLTQERLREVLSYDPETGTFRWLKARGSAGIGYVAGSPDQDGYTAIGIDGSKYKAHRLAWFYHYGVWPQHDLDHRDCVKSHNAIRNLRPATVQQNQTNKPVSARNTSGLKGAMWNKAAGRWRSIIKCGGKAHFLGYFDTKEEAHAAYAAKAKELHGDFARTA